MVIVNTWLYIEKVLEGEIMSDKQFFFKNVNIGIKDTAMTR